MFVVFILLLFPIHERHLVVLALNSECVVAISHGPIDIAELTN